MAGRYRFILSDVLTGQVLSDAVSLRVSSYARRLNNATTCQAVLDLASPSVRALTDPVAATEPRRSALWVIRNETPVWGGIIWTRRYRSGDNALDPLLATYKTQVALAERMGVDKGTVSRWVHGANPTLEHYLRLVALAGEAAAEAQSLPVDVATAIANDTRLRADLKQHLLSQYQILLEASMAAQGLGESG